MLETESKLLDSAENQDIWKPSTEENKTFSKLQSRVKWEDHPNKKDEKLIRESHDYFSRKQQDGTNVQQLGKFRIKPKINFRSLQHYKEV